MNAQETSCHYDLAYVSTVTGDVGFSIAISEAAAELNLSFLVITPNKRDVAIYKNLKIDCIYAGPYHSINKKKSQNDAEVRISDDYIYCERSYFHLPVFLLRRYAKLMREAVAESLKNIKIDIILQSQGGEIIRGIIQAYAKQRNISLYYFGEFHNQLNGTVLYKNDQKELAKPRKGIFSNHSRSSAVVKEVAVVKYDRQINHYSEIAAAKIISYVLSRDIYSLSSAVGYRCMLWKNKIINKIIGQLTRKNINFKNNKSAILVPLNVSAESELFIRNKKYINPLSLIPSLEVLKNNYNIIIKGHPGASLSIGLFDILKFAYNKFYVLHSEIPASQILKEAHAVIFVSSTVGVEAIKSGTPILCLGNWPYKELAIKNAVKSCSFTKAITVDKDSFFGDLADYIFPGHSYGTQSQLLTLLESITRNENDT